MGCTVKVIIQELHAIVGLNVHALELNSLFVCMYRECIGMCLSKWMGLCVYILRMH